MGRRCVCRVGLRGRDGYLPSAASVYRHTAAAVMTWLGDNAEAIILAGVMGILWFFMMVA
jgi:hypothetical protein